MGIPGIGSLIQKVVGGASKIIDDLHTSDEERMAAQAKLAEVNQEATLAGIRLEEARIEAERALVDAQSRVIQAEQGGLGWWQRNWRGIVMTALCGYAGIFIGVGLWQGTLTQDDKDNVFQLLTFGFTGGILGSYGVQALMARNGKKAK